MTMPSKRCSLRIGRSALCRSILAIAVVLVVLVPQQVHSSATGGAAATATSSAMTTTGSKSNPVGQLVGYVKTSVVRTVDGCQELWSNHGRCNDIRKKMSQHRALVQEQWETDAVDSGVTMTKQDIKQRLKSVQGGITYDDYIFLQKGKEDRSKVMNMGFLMWGAPKFLPYAMMFNPDMLPSPFQSVLPTTETSAQKLSRERSAAVIETLLAMEKSVVVNGMFAKLNIFGGKKREEQKSQLADIASRTASLMRSPHMPAAAATSNTNTATATNTGAGASLVLQQLESHLYSATEFSKSEKRCNQVPACIAKGLSNVIGGGGGGGSMFAAIAPSFLARGKVMGHIKKVTDADEFITQSAIDLKSINKRLLKEACNERLIGGPNRSEDELRSNLQDWLNLVVKQPAARLQKAAATANANGAPDPALASSSASSVTVPSLYFNENLARLALMGYYSCVSVRDARSVSVLPRLLFGGSSVQQGSSSAGSNSDHNNLAVGELTAKRKFFSRSE